MKLQQIIFLLILTLVSSRNLEILTSKGNTIDIKIRKTVPDDMARIFEIDKSCENSWTVESLRLELEKDSSLILTAQCGDMVCGYCICRFVLDEMEILSIGVESGKRRQGIATAILKELKITGQETGIRIIHLEVRETNIAAINLYLSAGFNKCGYRKKYYGDENAILMSSSI